MLLLRSETFNPYFNIATEEYLLKNRKEDMLFLYRNTPSVIIGKHQIRNLEINIPYITNEQIPVIRRISGGGSVFHDKNNLNYCIITSSEKVWVDFEKFTQPLIEYLQRIGLSPQLRSKSDIRIEGKKISGNASHIYKRRVLHHGSILFATDLEALTNALKNKPTSYKSKTVHSRRSVVTNITSHLNAPVSTTKFENDFAQTLLKNGILKDKTQLNSKDKKLIKQFVEQKYQTTDWNIAYNANYTFKNTFFYNNELIHISIKVQKGICKSIQTKGTLEKDIQQLTENVPHETSAFTNVLKNIFSKEEVLNYFF